MDIKLTNTGVIPLDDFREGQNFLVWFDIHCSGAVLLYKAGDEFLCSGNLRSVPKTQEFLAWEPVEIQHSFSPYVTKELWLISPDFYSPIGWVFKDLEFPYKEFRCIIRDRDFIDSVYKKGNCQFVAGDFFGAEITLSPNEDGFFELFRLRHLGTNNEKFREIFLGRE